MKRSTLQIFGKGVLIILFCGLFLETYAQGSGQQPGQSVKLPSVIPPSPDAAALGKYGNMPVGLYTGIPDITIPLYTIKSKSLEVPISISYHASGIKVNEIASWIGLGWSINTGGMITRSVVGLPDDVGFWYTNVQNSSQINVTDYDYLKGIANGINDGESDYYFYNFNGHSGKFVYSQDNKTTPVLIPQSPIQVKFINGHFEVTDEMGVLYKFADIENIFSSGYDNGAINSSYYLSEIISADEQDHIQFSYITEATYSETDVEYTEIVGDQCPAEGVGNPSHDYHSLNSSVNSRTIVPLRLKEITFANGKIEFFRDTSRSDAPSSRLSELRVFSKNSDGTYPATPLKKFVFGEDYFVSATGTATEKYRLKLTGVTENDAQGAVVKKYEFQYNEATILPHRTSLAQDWWGFYNGHNSNTSLIATISNFDFNNHPYSIGAANREPDSTAMQACILNKIIYPTGGYTEFYYEPHFYPEGTSNTPQSISASSGIMGNTTDLLQQTVTLIPNTSGWATVNTFCSNVTDTEPFFSAVTVRKQNDAQYLLNHNYNPYEYIPFNAELSKQYSIYLTAGITYELKVMSKGHSNSTLQNGAAFSSATLSWNESITTGQSMAGGLRVKEIRDFESAGASPIKRLYKYGISESGNGVLLIPAEGINNSSREIDFDYSFVPPCSTGAVECPGCTYACTGKKLHISSSTPYDLTTLNGATVVYPEIAIYENSVSAPNGKEVHKFDVQVDEFTYAHKAYHNGRFQLNSSWKGGEEIYSTVYKGNSQTKVKEANNVYSIYFPSQTIGTKIGYWKVYEGCQPSKTPDLFYLDLYFFDYPVYTGVKKLTSSKETSYSSTEPTNSIESQVDYYYDNVASNHQQLSRKITLDSEGNSFETQYWYTADYNVDGISSLLSKNIIGVPIKEEVHKNNTIVSGRVNHLDVNGKPYEIYQYESAVAQPIPAHDMNVVVPPGYVKKANISYNESTKNIESIQKTNDTKTSYLWGYNNTLLIAEVKNAEIGAMSINYSATNTVIKDVTENGTDVALSPAFEVLLNQSINPSINTTILGTNGPPNPFLSLVLKKSDGTLMKTYSCAWGTGNTGSIDVTPGVYQWYYSAVVGGASGFNGYHLNITTNYVDQHTGYKTFHTSFEENGVISTDARTGDKVWSGACTINLPGYNGDYKLTYWKKTGTAEWSLIETPITVSAGIVQTMTIGDGSSIIDEVRLFPIGAFMTTYTYNPLVGITSVTDVNNVTTHYEYDTFGRLSVIKDSDGNIQKKYTYHYK